ncbi:MAG: UDP-N-acetylmuramate--L-alanine ligase [Patescibacteria group bacterium]
MKKVTPKHYFMVGIGGIGMQALADVLLGMGNRITGSDIQDFPGRKRLESKGAKVIIGEQIAENVPTDINELIYTSAAARPDTVHLEIEQAKKMGRTAWKRSEFIGELMKNKIGIAVSGTHGKTTVSTLITLILQEAGMDPTALIGAEVKSLEGCGILGRSEYWVIEACEYDRAFLDMRPKIAVLTNIDADHLDYYQDINEIKQAFAQFLQLVPTDGLVVACGDDPNILEILPQAKSKVIKFGFSTSSEIGNNLVARDIIYQDGKMKFAVDGIQTWLKFPGKHLVMDALAAIAVAKHLKVSDAVIKMVLENKFQGADRRFEIVGNIGGVAFVDDYGHHPTEIQATLAAARDYFGGRKIRVVFQAHQYSRTRLLLNEFAQSFGDADEVLIAPILAVRDSEEDIQAIDNNRLAEAIDKISHNARAYSDFQEISDYLSAALQPGEVVISLGAGKNSDWIKEFVSAYSQTD